MNKYIVFHDVQFGSTGEQDPEVVKKNTTRFWNAFIIPNHYSHSLDAYQDLAKELRKNFPEAKDRDIECLTVIQSGWCKNMPLIRFLIDHEPTVKEREGFTIRKNHLPDVVWN